MGAILDALVAYFADAGWPHEADTAAGVVAFPAGGANGDCTGVAYAFEDRGQLAVYAVWPERVPPARREAAAIFVALANHGLVVGNFELDLDDGELRFKASLDLGGAAPARAAIDPLVASGSALMDRYAPGIRAVARGADPRAAIALVEGPAGG